MLQLLFLFICSVALLPGQTQQAVISGEVADASGAGVVGAKVSAVNVSTNISVLAITNGTGHYSLRNLEIGSYTVTVSHEGFRRFQETGIVLQTAETLGLNVKLDVGPVAETVSVSANAATIEDKTSVIAQTFEQEEVADLPLGDRRTMNLISLVAGAVFVSYDTGGKPNFSLAGGRTQSQMLCASTANPSTKP